MGWSCRIRRRWRSIAGGSICSRSICMPHDRQPAIFAHKPAEAVADFLLARGSATVFAERTGAHGQAHGLLERGVSDQPCSVKRRVPPAQILDRRVDAAVAEHIAGATLVGALPVLPATRVAIGTVRFVVLAGDVQMRRAHSERTKDVLAQNLLNSFICNGLQQLRNLGVLFSYLQMASPDHN